MAEKNRIKMTIAGNELVISAQEDDEYIKKIGKRVDTEISNIIRSGNNFNIPMAAILSAINYCDSYEKQLAITEELREEASKSEEMAKEAIRLQRIMIRENKELKEEKIGLHKRIEELKDEIERLKASGARSAQQAAISSKLGPAPVKKVTQPEDDKPSKGGPTMSLFDRK